MVDVAFLGLRLTLLRHLLFELPIDLLHIFGKTSRLGPRAGNRPCLEPHRIGSQIVGAFELEDDVGGVDHSLERRILDLLHLRLAIDEDQHRRFVFDDDLGRGVLEFGLLTDGDLGVVEQRDHAVELHPHAPFRDLPFEKVGKLLLAFLGGFRKSDRGNRDFVEFHDPRFEIYLEPPTDPHRTKDRWRVPLFYRYRRARLEVVFLPAIQLRLVHGDGEVSRFDHPRPGHFRFRFFLSEPRSHRNQQGSQDQYAAER